MNARHFLRMAQWVHRPPSQKRVILVAVVLAICAAIYGAERLFGLHDKLPQLNSPKVRVMK
jgi:uncharacterized phage infection (PIP) family protein YhgE